ncbi:MAG: hypothetical protein U0704_18015 [Candidatus Eisenbacteria bacterium]
MIRPPRTVRALLAVLLCAVAAASAGAAPVRAPAPARPDPWKTHAALVARDNTLYLAGQYGAIATLMDSLLASPGVKSDPGLLRIALTRRSRAHLMLLEYPPAAAVSARAFALSEAARDTATMIRALRVYVIALEKTGDIAQSLRLCARGAAMAKRRNQPRDESYLHLRHGYALVAQGRSREAVQWFGRAAEAGVRSGDAGDELRATAGLAAAQYQIGALVEARASYARGIALATKLDDAFELSYLCLNDAEMEMAIGDPDAAPALAQAAIEASRRSAQLNVELKARRVLSNYEAARGAWDRVDSMMTAVITLAEPLGDREPLASALLFAAEARTELGRTAEADALIRRAAALVDTLIPVNAAFASQMLVFDLHKARRDADAVRWADDLCARLAKRMPAESYWRVRLYRGLALQSLGRHREALVAFRETAAITRPTATTPGGVEYDWALALAAKSLHGLGAVDSSIAGYRRAIGAWERARSARTREELLLDSEDYGLEIGCGLANVLLDARRAVPRDRRVIEAFTELQRFHALAVTERLLGPAAGAEARRKPFDFAAWRQHTLRPGEVFVDVTPDDDSTLVLAVTRRDVRAWRIAGKDALDKRLARFSDLVAGAGTDDPTVRQVATAPRRRPVRSRRGPAAWRVAGAGRRRPHREPADRPRDRARHERPAGAGARAVDRAVGQAARDRSLAHRRARDRRACAGRRGAHERRPRPPAWLRRATKCARSAARTPRSALVDPLRTASQIARETPRHRRRRAPPRTRAPTSSIRGSRGC